MSTITVRKFVSPDGTQELTLAEMIALAQELEEIYADGASKIDFDPTAIYPAGSIGERLLGQYFLNRANHSGTQAISTVEGLTQALTDLQQAIAGIDIWSMRPIGEVFSLWDHMDGVVAPPTNNPNYRYIRLTASDSYNTGALRGETISGASTLIQATAIIDDASSPMNNMLVRLINSERRTLKAGNSGGTQSAAYQDHTHAVLGGGGTQQGTPATAGLYGGSAASINSTGGVTDDSYHLIGSRIPTKNLISFSSVVSDQTSTTSNETRVKNIGATYYMRIR